MTTKGERYAAAIAAQLRAEKGASQFTVEQIVARSGVSKATFHRYLNGDRDIPMSSLVMIADALGVSLAVLVARAEERLIDED